MKRLLGDSVIRFFLLGAVLFAVSCGVQPTPTATPKTILVLETDGACAIYLDGEEVARLATGETKNLAVAAGESSLKAVSTENVAVAWSEVEKVGHGKRKVVRIALAAGVQAERERVAREAHERSLREKYGNWTARDGERYFAYADGAVWDTQFSLEWKAGSDSDTNYDQAVAWVNSLGGGWRMPTRAEMQTLHQKGAGDRNITPLLKTTGWWVWTEPRDESSAWYLFFYPGCELPLLRRGGATDHRAFAVRVRSGR